VKPLPGSSRVEAEYLPPKKAGNHPHQSFKNLHQLSRKIIEGNHQKDEYQSVTRSKPEMQMLR
jgi:hypothetical protein